MSTKKENLLFGVCVLLALFRFSAFGFAYMPLLDDFVQYGVYPHLPKAWSAVLTGGAGTIYTRPLAALGDVYVWGRLWGKLGIALFLLTLLYTASGILFYQSARLLEFPLSPWFLLLYLFLPQNMEGTYWLSAATRIVPSLFFAAAGIYLLARFLKGASGWNLAGYACFCLFSCGFYEQTAAVSCVLGILILVWKKRWRWVFIPVLSIGLLAAYYLLFGGLGDNKGRMGFLNASEFFPHIRAVCGQLRELLLYAARVAMRGVPRGWNTVVQYRLWIWGTVGIALILFWGIAVQREKQYALTGKEFLLHGGLGVMLVVVAFAPFFLIETVWLNFRNLVPALLGFGILADAIVRFLVRSKWVHTILSAAVLALCLIISVSELADYHTTGRMDWYAAREVARQMEEEGVQEAEFTSSLPVYAEQNAPYHDHIMSVFGSYWGISGAVRAVSENFDLKPVLITEKTER